MSQRTIWKYPLDGEYSQTIMVPQGAELLTVQMQGGSPQLWALVDPKATPTARQISIVGTGHSVASSLGAYLGTFQIDGGALVFHVFEETA